MLHAVLMTLMVFASEPIVISDPEGYEFHLQRDVKASTVRLSTMKATQGFPKNPSLTLFYDGKTGRSLKLEPLSTHPNELPQFQGKLAPEAQSFTGIELKFSWGTSSKKKVIRWSSVPSGAAERKSP